MTDTDSLFLTVRLTGCKAISLFHPSPHHGRCTATVFWRAILRIEDNGRADGEIVRILKRGHSTVVGEFLDQAAAAVLLSLTMIASSSGLKFPTTWRSRRAAGVSIEWESSPSRSMTSKTSTA